MFAKELTSTDSSGEFRRQGSLRRVLPPEPNILVHDIETDKLYKIFHQEYIIMAEYKMIETENLRGIYVIPSYKCSFLWFGVIFVRSGPYENGIFRFNINLPETFPECTHPKVEFQSYVFHPCIDSESGELNIKGGFPEWRKGEEHLWQVLKYITYVFTHLQHAIKYSVNKDASDMYINNRAMFTDKVSDCVQRSIKQVYDPPSVDDKHYIKFSMYDSSVHNPIRLAIVDAKDHENNRSAGHSWVEPGTFKPFSKSKSGDNEL